MFAKVFYSIAHFVFILHLLFACVLWLRARGNVKMQALALLMALLAVFFLLKLWAFGLVLHPLDLRPALMSGYVTMVLCMVPRIWFTSPRTVFRNSLCVLLPGLFPLFLYLIARLSGVQFHELEFDVSLWSVLSRPDVWLRLLMFLPIPWYAIRSFRILCRVAVEKHSACARVYAVGCLGFIPAYLFVFLDGSMPSQLGVQLYFLLFDGVLVYLVLFGVHECFGAEKFPPPGVNASLESVTDSLPADCADGCGPLPASESASETGADTPVQPGAVPEPKSISPLYARLESYMQHDEPWRNPELTLADVVSMLYTNRTSLAQAIREAGYAGFKEYVGYYRIREFKRLVGLGRVESLEQGFRAVGFRSKTTAFRNFSRFEEMTPMEYVRRHSPVAVRE
ncbi:hypothetical protein [uncultured Alistipes sp.]|uniref:hypothetical protein n=2 Tax=Alistipes TaxID=239759 RepID=UPI0026294293|nr:hypothetical protein [uncultured Alistipes sp.]